MVPEIERAAVAADSFPSVEANLPQDEVERKSPETLARLTWTSSTVRGDIEDHLQLPRKATSRIQPPPTPRQRFYLFLLDPICKARVFVEGIGKDTVWHRPCTRSLRNMGMRIVQVDV